jgi:hypothetical protein
MRDPEQNQHNSDALPGKCASVKQLQAGHMASLPPPPAPGRPTDGKHMSVFRIPVNFSLARGQGTSL